MAEESQTEPVGTQYKFIDSFTDGIRKDVRSDALPDGGALTARNVTIRDGLVEIDKGYAQFMDAIEGSPQSIFTLNYANGTTDLILVTTTTVFERLAGQWVYSIESDGTNIHRTTLTAAVPSGATLINVVSVTGMSATGKIGVRYIASDSVAITATTKGATSTYRVAGEQVYNAGDKIVVTGYLLGTWNVEQTVSSTTVAADATYTDIVTTLNSSGFANTTSTTPKIERFGTAQEHRTTIVSTSTIVGAAFVASEDAPSLLLTDTAHGLVDGRAITVTTDGTLPTGLLAGVNYYVRDKTPNTFKVALTQGGTAIAWTNAGSGTHTWASTPLVTLTDALPDRALKLASVILPIALNGSDDYIPDHVSIPNWKLAITGSTDALIEGTAVVTNNVDRPFLVCKGAGGTTVRLIKLTQLTASPFLAGSTALTDFRAKTVELFNNKLIFGRCYETVTNFNSRVRMSAATLYENFTAEDGGEVYDLGEGDSNIQSIRVLGKLLIVYKRGIVYRGDYIASVNASTRFQSTITNEGAISTHAVVKVPGKHYVVGSKNVYEYTGGMVLTNIGDPIREDLFAPSRFANISMKEFIHCSYDPELQEFLLFYPEGAIKGMRKAFRYSEQYKAWSTREYTHYFNFATTFRSSETLTWGQLEHPWTNYNQPWTSAFFVDEKLHRFYLGQGKLVNATGTVVTGSSYVYDANAMATQDGTYTIPWQYDTKDFYLPNSFIRVDFLDLYTQGDDVTLWYSEDLGNLWTRVRALEPKSALQQERIHLNKAAKRIRFRLKGSSTNFQLGWAGFSYTPEFSW